MKKQVYVTRPSLPELEEFLPYLEDIWVSRVLTNNGTYHQLLEKALCKYLGVKYLSLFSNGTIALVTALQALKIKGEVITTPFSFAATTHSLWWNNLKPVFVDIDPQTFTLNPQKIEAAITPLTTAILPVHVYGNPCNVEEIEKIAQRYGLKVIYDAAHCFGATYKNKSIAVYGDLSILSFHATKVFNTFEGGAIICHDKITKQRIDFLKNFGFADEVTIVEPGINGKMNEFQAALGLLQLKHINKYIRQRKVIFEKYMKNLKGIKGIILPDKLNFFKQNYGYFPILIEKNVYGMSRDEVYDLLKEHGFFARKYFFPLISNFPSYRKLKSSSKMNLKIANSVAQKVLCLPIYPDLHNEDQNSIMSIIKQKLVYGK